MNTALVQPNELMVVEPPGITELVRGTDQRLVALFAPLVQRQNIALDLGKIERIDAAGIAALITLYTDAQHAGQTFAVCNLSAHVAEILGLVGLAHILVTQDAALTHSSARHCACAA